MANTKITTGADATIVAAATRAGLAAAPPDYSDTFENVSRSYAETVKASGDMWNQIFNATALIGGELMKNAADWNSKVQKVYDAGGTENVVNEIYALKDELRDLGPLSGIFGNRETRKKRMEIITRKNQLFSEIDQLGETLNRAAIAIENNNLDLNLMGPEKAEMLNAIIASNTSNKVTAAGHYAKITKNDKGGLSYTIYNEDGSEATYSDGSTRTINLSDFKSLLSENVADTENVYGNAMNELSTSAENLGATYGGEYTDYHSGKMRGALNNMTNTANDRRRLMRISFGIDNKSFYEHITGGEQNVETAGLWTLMMKDLAAGEVKGELAVTTGQRGKLLTNIKDTDGSGGISQDEINNQWMAFTGSLLSGESDFSKQAIIDYADKKFKLNFDFGARQKALGKNGDGSGSQNYGIPSKGLRLGPMINGQYQQLESQEQVVDFIDRLKTGKEIQYQGNEYTFENGEWVENRGIEGVEEKIIGSADDMRRDIFRTTNKGFMGIETEQKIDHKTGKKVEEDSEDAAKTNLLGLFKNKNQNEVIEKLNESFDFSSKGYEIIKPPSVLGAFGRFFMNYKAGYLVVKGPNGGFLSLEDFEKGNLVEYGGNSGNKPKKGMKVLVLNLDNNHSQALKMKDRLDKIIELTGAEEKEIQSNVTPTTPIDNDGI